jgi:hypothetical protein
VRPGDPVLVGAFTLAPVLGAVANAGGRPVLVEITPDLVIDMDDLAAKAAATGARHLLVSHMRGHVADLERLATLCDRLGLALIEDCAHSLGATWAGRPTGSFGLAGAFSFQSAKHVNAGEGGIIATSDPDLAARAILHSGSYMLYRQNGTCPPEEVMARWRDRCANFSLRLSELAAELALAQLADLPRGRRLERQPRPHRRAPRRNRRRRAAPPPASRRLRPKLAPVPAAGLLAETDGGFRGGLPRSRPLREMVRAPKPRATPARPRHWSRLPGAPEAPATQAILDTLCDIRLPLGLTPEDCDRIAETVAAASKATLAANPA